MLSDSAWRRKHHFDANGDRFCTVKNNSSCALKDMQAEKEQFEQDMESIFGKNLSDLHDDHKE